MKKLLGILLILSLYIPAFAQLNISGGMGTGTAGQVAYWTSANSLGSDSGLAYTASSGALAVGTSTVYGGDAGIYRDAASVLGVRNGTATTALRVYNSYTSSAVNEFLEMRWTGNEGYVATNNTGASSRVLKVGTVGASAIQFFTTNAVNWTIATAAGGGALSSAAGIAPVSVNTGASAVRSLRTGTPVVTGDGTLVANSQNSQGKVLSTVTAAASIVVTFSSAFDRAPACTVSNETTAVLARATSTTTAVTITSTTVTGDSLSYICIGF